MYLDPLDHFVKEELRVGPYLRYTDDFVILHENPMALASLLPAIRSFLSERLALELHPRKIVLRKLRQGFDFLGYVTLPHYRVLRTTTKRRMLKRINPLNVASYRGMLSHCAGHGLEAELLNQSRFCGIIST